MKHELEKYESRLIELKEHALKNNKPYANAFKIVINNTFNHQTTSINFDNSTSKLYAYHGFKRSINLLLLKHFNGNIKLINIKGYKATYKIIEKSNQPESHIEYLDDALQYIKSKENIVTVGRTDISKIQNIWLFFNIYKDEEAVKKILLILKFASKYHIYIKAVFNFNISNVIYKYCKENNLNVLIAFTTQEKAFEHFNCSFQARTLLQYEELLNNIHSRKKTAQNYYKTIKEKYKNKEITPIKSKKILIKYDNRTQLNFKSHSNDNVAMSFFNHHKMRIDNICNQDVIDRHKAIHNFIKQRTLNTSSKMLNERETLLQKEISSAEISKEINDFAKKDYTFFTETSLKNNRELILEKLNQYKVINKVNTTILNSIVWILSTLKYTKMKNKEEGRNIDNHKLDMDIIELFKDLKEENLIWEELQSIKGYFKNNLDIPNLHYGEIKPLLEEIHGLKNASKEAFSSVFSDVVLPANHSVLQSSLERIVRNLRYWERLKKIANVDQITNLDESRKAIRIALPSLVLIEEDNNIL